MRVKICGLMRPEDAVAAASSGADSLGVVLHADRPRKISPEQAELLFEHLPDSVTKIGVFVNAPATLVRDLSVRLKLACVQLHGQEDARYIEDLDAIRVIKAIAPEELKHWISAPPNVVALLIDTPAADSQYTGGHGQPNDWDAVQSNLQLYPTPLPIILAGGLNPQNVAGVVERFRSFGVNGVDVSTGVESKLGEKDAAKIQAFVKAVKGL